MKIYVDFDRTLFDCDQFLDDLYSLIDKYMISKSVFKDCQIQCKKDGFNLLNILEKVKKRVDFNQEIYQEIEKLMKNTNKYLYSDTIPFLEYAKKRGYEIIILTKGNDEFQKEKITNAKISKYYDDIIVTLVHKGNLDIDYVNAIFLDDNPKEIKSIMKKKPKKMIWIQRNNQKYQDISLNNKVLVYYSLNELINDKLI